MDEALKKELEKCKDAAEGTLDKQFYDFYILDFADYLKKYYSSSELTKWKQWNGKYVLPCFRKEGREEWYEWLKKYQPPFYPDYLIAEDFFDKLKIDKRFDNDLKYFFSFLVSCGFFIENKISFEEWINAKNWQRPWSNELPDSPKTILEILSYQYGHNYLKTILIEMPYFQRR
ncbi:MAG: hypothetical protein IPJ32_11840 [Sphingobacteriaceae bacterium]|nr:hypothetical protein [Sphingobacteriaceae bacterium]